MFWFWTGLFIASVSVTLTDAECHCNTTTACAVFPSTPCSQVGDPDRCKEGWFGPYCQKQNIALRRSSNQSSTVDNNTEWYGAGLGVDGRATTVATSLPWTCAHTKEESNPTWTVNLNTSVPEKIQHIRLYLRDDIFQNRSNGMEILVGSQMCYNWSSTEHPPPIANVTCRQPLTGTTVTIRIPGQQKYLSLCEVQIFVCSDGWFSYDCDRQCRCFNSTEVCDKITGHCSSGCFPGYTGSDCQTVCPNGTYGNNCSSMCGNCINEVICDKTKGTCPEGCEAGWMNGTCMQACLDGFYGINCFYQCGNCLDGDTCDKKNGTCPGGCAAGWMYDHTKLCKQPCQNGSYGINCTSQCGNCLDGVSCDKGNGTCPGECASGWMNDTCVQACPNGYHGNNCAAQCGNCLDGVTCDKTNETCPGAFKVTTNEQSVFACPDGSYGINCALQCGNCVDGVSCDKTNGLCPGGCEAGWINDGTCLQQCAEGTHGINCTADCGCGDFKARDTYSGWGISVTATLGVLLICIVTGTTIYIRRLLKQLESLKTKVREEHYVTLDEKTKTTETESTYEHISNATPYYNTVKHLQDETG